MEVADHAHKRKPTANDMVAAIRSGNLKKVKEITARGGLSRRKEWVDGCALVREALHHDHPEVAQFLIRAGARVIDTKEKIFILHEAVGKTLRFLPTVQLLLTKGASVNTKNEKGDSPLHCVRRVKIAELLFSPYADSQPDVSATNDEGLTPLHVAARSGKTQIAKYLLDLGVPVDCSATGDYESYSPLHIATKYNMGRVVYLLLSKGAVVNSTCKEGTPLHIACRERSASLVTVLLDQGAELEATDEKGKTPIFRAIEKGHADIVESLLDKGAVLKPSPEQLFASLTLICPELVKILLKHGRIIVNAKIRGRTALHFAVSSLSRFPDKALKIIRLLLAYGADVNAKTDKSGVTALMIALRNKFFDAFPILLKYGANFETLPNGDTLLHVCARAGGNPNLAYRAILERGADVNALNEDGQTPLHLACSIGLFAPEGLLECPDVDVDARDKEGRTALWLAARKLNVGPLTALLGSGADINIPDNTGLTPAIVAVRRSRGYFNPYRDDCFVNVSIALRTHFAKLTAANLSGSEVNLSACEQTLYKYERRLQQRPARRYTGTAYTADDPEFSKLCEDELSKMKSEMIGNSCISYFDILSSSNDRVAIYTKHVDVSHVMHFDDFVETFPVYGTWIKCRLRRAKRQMQLLEEASASLKRIFVFLPHICVDIIRDFLSKEDLKKLSECT